jgi:predicted dinucleotide-binding enzyme
MRSAAMQIAMIGAGRIGQTLASLWAAAGHRLTIASADGASAQALADQLSQARAAEIEPAVAHADALLVAVPFKAWPALAARLRSMGPGLPLLDATNVFPQRDGALAQAMLADPSGSSAQVAQLVPAARVVKAFNTVHFSTLRAQAHRLAPRLAIPIAGDDSAALAVAAQLIRDAGFDPVIVGDLRSGRVLEPGRALFGDEVTAEVLQQQLRA